MSVTENAIAPQSSKDAPVKLNSSASAMLANMAQATAGMATKAELDATINANKPRPSANTETSDISQVYPVEVLIPSEALAAIQVRAWQTAMKDQQDVKVASRFVANRLLKFKDNATKLKMLRYVLLLIEFYNAAIPGKFGRKIKRPDELKLILNGQPESLLQGVKRKFSDGPMMSRHQADLLITHICAIALVLENYEVDTWDLKEDLKLDVNPMTQYFKEVGARVGSMPDGVRKSLGIDKAAAAQRRIAKLKIPLEFPATKFVRAGRR
jgi:DNA-directed RNA polymerase I subunit RPA49